VNLKHELESIEFEQTRLQKALLARRVELVQLTEGLPSVVENEVDPLLQTE